MRSKIEAGCNAPVTTNQRVMHEASRREGYVHGPPLSGRLRRQTLPVSVISGDPLDVRTHMHL
jgi:hypothetical protein